MENSFYFGVDPPFIIFKYSAEWMRPTHIIKSNMLYSTNVNEISSENALTALTTRSVFVTLHFRCSSRQATLYNRPRTQTEPPELFTAKRKKPLLHTTLYFSLERRINMLPPSKEKYVFLLLTQALARVIKSSILNAS